MAVAGDIKRNCYGSEFSGLPFCEFVFGLGFYIHHTQ